VRVLSETASTLTIHYPVWLGLAGLVVGYALAGWLIKSARGSKKPVQHVVAGVGGFIIVSIVAYGAFFDRVTLDARGARETRLMNDESVAWKDVVEVSLVERRVGRRGMQPHLLLRKTPHGEMAAEISGLAPEEIERVLAFARQRAAAR
jgi:hypothetical protein